MATFHSYLATEKGSEERSKELLLLQCYLEATDGEYPEDMNEAVKNKLTEMTKGRMNYP
jgi:hypothetical protein